MKLRISGLFPFVLVCLTTFLTGCISYDVPIVKKHTIPIDSSLLGYWEQTISPEEDEVGNQVQVERLSDTEYRVDYAGTLYRAYHFNYMGKKYIQFEERGGEFEKLTGEDAEDNYYVARHLPDPEHIVLFLLNVYLTPAEIKDADRMNEVLGSYEGTGVDEGVFSGMRLFKRVEKKAEPEPDVVKANVPWEMLLDAVRGDDDLCSDDYPVNFTYGGLSDGEGWCDTDDHSVSISFDVAENFDHANSRHLTEFDSHFSKYVGDADASRFCHTLPGINMRMCKVTFVNEGVIMAWSVTSGRDHYSLYLYPSK